MLQSVVSCIWAEMTRLHIHYSTKPQILISHFTLPQNKNLGIWITPIMNFSVRCHRAASKANQALGMIKRNFNTCPNVPLRHYSKHLFAHIWNIVPQFGVHTILKTSIHLKRCREGPQSLFQLFLHLIMNLD